MGWSLLQAGGNGIRRRVMGWNLLQAGGNGMREQEGEECEVFEAGGKAEGRRETNGSVHD